MTEVIEKQELINIKQLDIADVFKEGGAIPILEKIREIALKDLPKDAETKESRDFIKSRAYAVARSKTTLDNAGKDLKQGWMDKCKLVDNERKVITHSLDELKNEIRKPVTEWEEAEQKRIAQAEEDRKRKIWEEEEKEKKIEQDKQDQIKANQDKVAAEQKEAQEKLDKEKAEFEETKRKEAKEAQDKQDKIDKENRLKNEEAEAKQRKVAEDNRLKNEAAETKIREDREKFDKEKREHAEKIQKEKDEKERLKQVEENKKIAEENRILEKEVMKKIKCEAYSDILELEGNVDIHELMIEGTKYIVDAIQEGKIRHIKMIY